MIDIHSHILPGIDDGSRNIEETAEMIKQAKDAGFDTIISTSHYMEGYFEADVEKRKKLIEEVKEILSKENIDMDILIGSEIYITEDINKYLKESKASTLNDTNYCLFEFPLNAKPHNMYDLVFEIQKGNNIPILAHPERYRFIENDPDILYELIDRGVLMQVNYR